MKLFNPILAGLLLVASVGCSDKLEETTSNNSNQTPSTYSICVGAISESADTKMSVTVQENIWTTEWESDDSVLAWHSDGAESYQLNKFTVSEITNGRATIDGDAYSGYDNIRFIYPYNESLSVEDGKIAIDISSQSIDLTDAYNAYGESVMYMFGDLFSPNNEEEQNVTMRHLLTSMVLNFTPSELSSSPTLVSVTIDGVPSAGVLSYDYDHENTSGFGITDYEKMITIEIANGSISNNELVSIPFATLPFATSDGHEVSFTLNFEDGSFYSASATYSGESNYTRAAYNNFTPDSYIFDAGKLSMNFELSDFSEISTAPAAQTWYISDSAISSATDLKSAIDLANTAGYDPNIIFTSLSGNIDNSVFGNNSTEYSGRFSIDIRTTASDLTFGTYAFKNCTGLISAKIDSGFISTGNNPFYDCVSLTYCELQGATALGNTPFYGCTSLETLKLPKLNTLVNNYIQNVESLKEMYIGIDGDSGITSTGGSNPFNSGTTTSTNIYIKKSELVEVTDGVTLQTYKSSDSTAHSNPSVFLNIVIYETDGTYTVYNTTYSTGENLSNLNDVAGYIVVE